jgi:hypothetical protein
MENAKALIAKKDANGIIALIDSNLNDGTQNANSKAVVNYIATNIGELKQVDAMAVCDYAIDKIKGIDRSIQFELEVSISLISFDYFTLFIFQDSLFKREKADIYIAKEDHDTAARTLESINTRDGSLDIMDKVDIWLSIADCWFDAEDSVNSESYINKAAH